MFVILKEINTSKEVSIVLLVCQMLVVTFMIFDFLTFSH